MGRGGGGRAVGVYYVQVPAYSEKDDGEARSEAMALVPSGARQGRRAGGVERGGLPCLLGGGSGQWSGGTGPARWLPFRVTCVTNRWQCGNALGLRF
jgi:hypothetical protein